MLEGFLALLLFGPWMWAAFVFLTILIICGLESESGWTTFGGLCLGALAIWFAHGFEMPSISGVFTWLDHNWLNSLMFIAAYAVIGAGWSVAKWFFRQIKIAQGLKEKANYLSQKNIDDRWAEENKLSTHKSMIMTWIVYWPWSMLWTLTNDPIRHAARFIYDRLSGTYTRISNYIYDTHLKGIKP